MIDLHRNLFFSLFLSLSFKNSSFGHQEFDNVNKFTTISISKKTLCFILPHWFSLAFCYSSLTRMSLQFLQGLRIAKWWENEDLTSIVIAFADGKSAFTGRLVSRLWRRLLEAAGSPRWESIITAVLPSCCAPTLLLKKYCPRYAQLRHFSKMSLANQLTLQHVVVFDVGFYPIVWLTNVNMSTQVADIMLVVCFAIPPERRPADVGVMEILGNGLLLEARKTLTEHVWPGRGGRSGCRGDLCVVVKNLQLDVETRDKLRHVHPLEFSEMHADACHHFFPTAVEL